MDAMALGSLLRDAMTADSGSPKAFARGHGFSEQTCKRACRGENISLATLDSICAVLGVRASDMLRACEELPAPPPRRHWSRTPRIPVVAGGRRYATISAAAAALRINKSTLCRALQRGTDVVRTPEGYVPVAYAGKKRELPLVGAVVTGRNGGAA